MKMFSTALPRRLACAVTGLLGAVTFLGSSADAKTPGSTYCFYKTCHRVKSLSETRALIGQPHTLPTSFYDSCARDPYNPCGLTSSGEVFRPNDADNAASPIYPDGTTLLVWSPATKQAAVLRINNAGPYWGGRKLDVSRGAAEKLGFKARGVADLKARVLTVPSRAEATYKFKRKYDPVLGHLGVFETMDAAASAALAITSISNVRLAAFNGGELNRLALAGYSDRDFKTKADQVTRVAAVPRARLKTWPVVGQSAFQIAKAKSKVMPWPVVAVAALKSQPPVRIARSAAIKWPVVGATLAQANGSAVKAKGRVLGATRVLSWSQTVSKAKSRNVRLASVKSRKVVASHIRPSRGLAAAARLEDKSYKSKTGAVRAARAWDLPAKRTIGKKNADARKRPLKLSFADPDFEVMSAKPRLTGRIPKLPSQYMPASEERKLQKPLKGPRLMHKALA